MTALEVVERIKKNLGVPWNQQTVRDTFKQGSPEIEVQGIATTFMATLDLLQRAHAAGLNFVITHEPTFWNDQDRIEALAADPVFRFKRDFCLKNNLTVWRFHDHIHAHHPDLIWTGLIRALGWTERASATNQRAFAVPPTTLGALAAQVQQRMKARTLRVVGDPNAKVATVAVGMGYSMPRFTPEIDVVMGGENPEANGQFDATTYALDAAALGIGKGQIILGHVLSEEPGMEDCAVWLRTFIPDVKIQFVPAGEPFWSPSVG